MHPVRLLLDRVPFLLVEPGQVRRTRGSARRVSLHRRHPRPGDQRTTRQPRGPLSALSLSYHHELRRCVPEGPESDQSHWEDQGNHGPADGLATIAVIDERTWSRLRWRCRRGLLENDILLTRYL